MLSPLACLSLALGLLSMQPPTADEAGRDRVSPRVGASLHGTSSPASGDHYMVVSHGDTSRFNQATLEGLVREMNSWASRGWEFVDVKIVPLRPSTYNPERYTLRSVHPDAVAYLLKRRPRL